MGGIVARLAMADLPGLVDVIITMSTPHALPPVTLSRDMDDVYNSLDQQVHNRTSHLLFSICGGTADTQIASDACVIPPKSISPDNGFTIFTTGMPGAWTGVEHQTMVWCHQIRSKVARTLLDMTASSHRQDKLAVARDWLLGEKSVVEPGHSNPIRVPVTATQMSLRISDSSYDTGSPIRWCREVYECQLVDAETAILPAPKNREAPFPLPGEGIRPEEKLIVLDFKLPESSGFIEVYTSQDHVQSGSYGRAIAQDNTWREC
jgi:glycosylphosphatidylinositol deacylase